jgi:hypothetical protein
MVNSQDSTTYNTNLFSPNNHKNKNLLSQNNHVQSLTEKELV